MQTRRIAAILFLLATLAAAPVRAENFSDIWWNPSESGWGVTIADHETNLFAVLYHYNASGKPMWWVIPGGSFSQGRRIFQGDLYATSGPPYTSATFDPAAVSVVKVGSASFDLAPASLAPGTILFTYTIGPTSRTKQLQRQAFGSATPNWGTDYTDLWFNPTQSGWGLSLAQHGNNMFGVWYTYDTSRNPTWFVLPGGTFASPGAFSGKLYQTTGTPYTSDSFDPSRVVVTEVGSASLSFEGKSLGLVDQEACPGFGANFVAIVGNANNVLLACRQPFGNWGPGTPTPQPTSPSTKCSGTYSATTHFATPCTSGGTRDFHGTFTISGITWTQTTPQQGTVSFANFFSEAVPDSCTTNNQGVNTCSCHDEYLSDQGYEIDVLVKNTNNNLSGDAQVQIFIGNVDVNFGVFDATVNGTMIYQYQFGDGTPVYNGQGTINCIAQ